MIDNAAIKRFTNGQCAALAVAIHELTGGWQIYGVYGSIGAPMQRHYNHVVVGVPNMTPWPWWGDITGVHEVDYRTRRLSPQRALSLPGYAPQDVEAARPYAEALVTEWIPDVAARSAYLLSRHVARRVRGAA